MVGCTESMDGLSQLPDDILMHILSFLSTEDVYRTSLVSRYCQRWLLFANEFDFNASGFIKPQDLETPAFERHVKSALKRRFFKWVSRVLLCLRDGVEEASVLSKLRIQFPLYLEERHQQMIDEWLSYAFARRVQSLELDLLIYSNPKCLPAYDPRLLGSLTKIDMSCLGSLSLSGINVSREDVDSFLLKCPFLEHLKVCNSNTLEGVEISNSAALALKHLEITYCMYLQCVIVRDTCLVSLTLTSVTNLMVENNPKLVSVCVSHWHYGRGSTLQVLSNCLSRLQILTLYIGHEHDEVVFHQAPKLIELKQLTLIAPLQVRLTTMLRLSPNLEKLVLDLEKPHFEENVDEYKKGPKVALQHLKAIQVRGYCGKKAEDELLMYVLEHVLAPIQTIIFDPDNFRWNRASIKNGQSVETRIQLFKRVIPSSIKFVVL